MMNKIKSLSWFLLFSLILFYLFPGSIWAKESQAENNSPVCIDNSFPHEYSELQADESIVFGRLGNGVRYVIKKNNKPADRVAIYLDVQAGSLHEKDEEQGGAHYLEHMMFNGTEHFPPDSLTRFFQSIGMDFGADTNAHTSFDETVYKLFMPSGDKKALDEGFLVLADFARRALLLEDEVIKEKGVILAEKRTRDTPVSRVWKKSFQNKFAGTRLALRDIIGIDRTLVYMTSDILRNFYDSWYRPDNMVVVIVGDVDENVVLEVLKKHFSPLKAGDVEPECFSYGKISGNDLSGFYFNEPDLGFSNVSFSTVWNVEPKSDSTLSRAELLENYLAVSIIKNRLQALLDYGELPFTGVQVYSGKIVDRFGYFQIGCRLKDDQWQAGVTKLENILRQLQQYGVTEKELERVRKKVESEIKKEVVVQGSRKSDELAASYVRAINSNEVILSPEQERDLYLPMLAEMSVDDVNAAFTRLIKDKKSIIEVSGEVVLPVGGKSPQEQILATWQEAKKTEILPWNKVAEGSFPYLKPVRNPSPVSSTNLFPSVNVFKARLDSGLYILTKQTDFKPGEVMVAVNFGKGMLQMGDFGFSKLAEAVVNDSGVGKLTKEELETALSGSTVSIDFAIKPESFVFTAKGLSGELELLFQLLQTHLNDPAFRQEAFERNMSGFIQMYNSFAGSVEGSVELNNDRFFTGNHPRYSWPDRKKVEKFTLEQIKQHLEPVFKSSGIEIAVVGDVEQEEVVRLARKYLGDRSGIVKLGMVEGEVNFPVGQQKNIKVNSKDNKTVQVLGWETDSFWNIKKTRRLNVLSSLLADKLIEEIREKLGASYSPFAYHIPSRVDKGFGLLRCMLSLAPDRVDEVKNIIVELCDKMTKEISEEELRRTIAPILTSIKDMQKTNEYWLDSVLSLSSRHPEQLAWPISLPVDYAEINAKEIMELAKKYLHPDNMAVLTVSSSGSMVKEEKKK